MERDLLLLQQQLDTIERDLRVHQEQEDQRWQHLIELTEQNTIASQQNAESIQKLTESTSGLLEAWITAVEVKKAGTAVGNFAKWLGGMGLFGAGLLWIWEHLPLVPPPS